MESLLSSLRCQLASLVSLLKLMDDKVYTRRCKIISDASVGEHLRHVYEFVECLVEGYEKGIVSYDNRKRNMEVEKNKAYAIEMLEKVGTLLSSEDKDLLLEYKAGEEVLQVRTNYLRELIFNIEHIVHHQALIRVSIEDVQEIQLPKEFGFAPSTLDYLKKQSVLRA